MSSSLCNQPWQEILERFLDKDCSLAVAICDQTWIITQSNEGFSRLLNLKGSPLGKNLSDFLLPSSHAHLNEVTGDGKEMKLNLLPQGEQPIVVQSRLYRSEKGNLFFGEHFSLKESDLMSKMSQLNNEMANLTRELHQKNGELQDAYERIKVLTGLLPICANCKNIRDDKGYWNNLEHYIMDHSDATFTHGICPECTKKLYPDFFENNSNEENEK